MTRFSMHGAKDRALRRSFVPVKPAGYIQKRSKANMASKKFQKTFLIAGLSRYKKRLDRCFIIDIIAENLTYRCVFLLGVTTK